MEIHIILAIMEMNDSNMESGYRLFKSDEDGFSFEIPLNCKDVVFSEQKIPTTSGAGKLKSYITENNEKAFMLGITDLGIELDEESAIRVMEYSRDNVSRASNTIASGNKEILGLPGLTLRVSRTENKVKTYMDILFCIFKDKQYQLEVITIAEAGLNEPDALHFFTSFKFLEK